MLSVASSHPLKFLFEAAPRRDNGVKSARVSILFLFLAVDFGLASSQTKEKQKCLTKEDGIGEPADLPSLPDLGGTSRNRKRKPPDSPKVRENNQNVYGGGIDSPILGELTTSTASQKQNYTRDEIQRRLTPFVFTAYLKYFYFHTQFHIQI